MHNINIFGNEDKYLENLSDLQNLIGGEFGYVAKAQKEKITHLNEYPDMVDIALWDKTTSQITMCRGWEYTIENYPTDRYTPIGVEVIPRSHMEDGKSRIMSLKYMRYNTPTIGGSNQSIYWGLYEQSIEGLEYKVYAPYINASGSTDFGTKQEIKGWNSLYSNDYVPSDMFTTLPNPFTKNQGYYYNYVSYNYYPSPYDKNMRKNPIFFMENPDSDNPSCLLNMDGKGETAKLLSQIEKNGNTNWKSGSTIPNITSDTLGWDKIAPAAQCCWMYHISDEFKDNPIVGQGCWYLPTIGELAYACARQKAINASLNQINTVISGSAIELSPSLSWSVSSISSSSAFGLDINSGYLVNRIKHIDYSVRAFALV